MIPRELEQYNQWVCWKRVGPERIKLPISPATGRPASSTDPATWGSYQQAKATASRFGLDGIGFVFTAADLYTGVDLDHCRTDGGGLEPPAAEVVKRLNSYTEWSPSGDGLHILVKASLQERSGRRSHGIEVYSSGRYFTITGDHLDGTPNTIEDRRVEILDLIAALDKTSHTRVAELSRPRAPITQTDEDLIRRAQQARNGAKFERLWTGDLSDYSGDHSRGDAALCSLLAYYTNGDAARIDRLFRSSGLYRRSGTGPPPDLPTAGSRFTPRSGIHLGANWIHRPYPPQEVPIDSIRARQGRALLSIFLWTVLTKGVDCSDTFEDCRLASAGCEWRIVFETRATSGLTAARDGPGVLGAGPVLESGNGGTDDFDRHIRNRPGRTRDCRRRALARL